MVLFGMNSFGKCDLRKEYSENRVVDLKSVHQIHLRFRDLTDLG